MKIYSLLVLGSPLKNSVFISCDNDYQRSYFSFMLGETKNYNHKKVKFLKTTQNVFWAPGSVPSVNFMVRDITVMDHLYDLLFIWQFACNTSLTPQFPISQFGSFLKKKKRALH